MVTKIENQSKYSSYLLSKKNSQTISLVAKSRRIKASPIMPVWDVFSQLCGEMDVWGQTNHLNQGKSFLTSNNKTDLRASEDFAKIYHKKQKKRLKNHFINKAHDKFLVLKKLLVTTIHN